MAAQPDLTRPLKVSARRTWGVWVGLGELVWAASMVVPPYWRDGQVGWLTQGFAFAIAAMALFMIIAGTVPVELVADEVGIHWRHFLFRRTIRWDEIASIGVGVSKVCEPADNAVASVFVRGRRFGPEPSLGIQLAGSEKDPGGAAYRRGFTGYDINIRADFDRGLRSIAGELQSRLDAARVRPVAT